MEHDEIFDKVKDVIVDQLNVEEDDVDRGGLVRRRPRRRLARHRRARHGARGVVRRLDPRRGGREDQDRRRRCRLHRRERLAARRLRRERWRTSTAPRPRARARVAVGTTALTADTRRRHARGHAPPDHRQRDCPSAHHPGRHGGAHLAVAARRPRSPRRAASASSPAPASTPDELAAEVRARARRDRRRHRRQHHGRRPQVQGARAGRHRRGHRPRHRRCGLLARRVRPGAARRASRWCRSWAPSAWRKLSERFGASAVIVEGVDAGGHLGTDEPMLRPAAAASSSRSTSRSSPRAASSRAPTSSAMLDAGAAGVQMGTRFAATVESSAPDAFKQMYVDATDDDIVLDQEPRRACPGRALRNPFTERLGRGDYPRDRAVHRRASRSAARSTASSTSSSRAQTGDVDGRSRVRRHRPPRASTTSRA